MVQSCGGYYLCITKKMKTKKKAQNCQSRENQGTMVTKYYCDILHGCLGNKSDVRKKLIIIIEELTDTS